MDFKDTTNSATVDVKGPVFSLTAPSQVCGTATYQILNPPTGANIQWSTSNGLLSLQSGQGTATAVFSPIGIGRESITANISYQCYQFTTRFNDISVGVPATSLINVTGGTYDNGIGTYSLCTDMPNDVTAAYFKKGTILEWEWQTSNYDWEIAEHPTGGLPEIWGQHHVIRLRALQGSNSSSPVNLYVRARNSCGWGDWKAMQYQVKSCYNFYLSPNPAVDYFDITPQSDESLERSAAKTATPLFDRIVVRDSVNNKIVREQKLGRSANSQRIDVKRLSAGVYFVELYTNSTLIEQQPLTIKKP